MYYLVDFLGEQVLDLSLTAVLPALDSGTMAAMDSHTSEAAINFTPRTGDYTVFAVIPVFNEEPLYVGRIFNETKKRPLYLVQRLEPSRALEESTKSND